MWLIKQVNTDVDVGKYDTCTINRSTISLKYQKKIIFIWLYDNLNIATPLPKQQIQDTISFPQVIQYALLISYLYLTNLTTV